MSLSKIRVATIGTWGHLGDAMTELRLLPEVEFVAQARAVAEEDIAYVRKFVAPAELPWFDDYRRMLSEVRPDLVIVSTRVDRINSIACDVADAGCHLICEKPLAITHENLAKLYDAVVAKGLQCAAILGNGRHPVMQAAAGVIASGQAGKIALINARKSYRWGESRPEWFGKRETYGGTIPWVAIHALEMIHLLSGQDFVSVAAIQSNAGHPERAGCEDNGAMLLQLSGGAIASVSFDLLRPSAAVSHGDDWVRVVGTEGVIEAAMDRGWCRFTSRTQPEQDLPLPIRGSYFTGLIQGILSGSSQMQAVTRRSFKLTHAALCARDAADKLAIISIDNRFG